MLKETLKRVNSLSAELAEKKTQSEEAGWELLTARLSLDGLYVSSPDDADVSGEAEKLRAKIDRLTAADAELSAKVPELEKAFEAARDDAVRYVKYYDIPLSEISVTEDGVLHEITLARDEKQIMARLIALQDEYTQAQIKYEECRQKIIEPEKDEQIKRAQVAYYNAKKAVTEFTARTKSATEAQKFSLMNENFALVDRAKHTKEEFDRIADEYGVLRIFTEYEEAGAECEAIKARYEKAKLDSEQLPLTAPLSHVVSGSGVITMLLGGAPVKGEPRDRESKQADGGAFVSLRTEADIADVYKMVNELRQIRRETVQFKRDAARMKANLELIERAKLLAAINLKKIMLAAKKSAAMVRDAEREIRARRELERESDEG